MVRFHRHDAGRIQISIAWVFEEHCGEVPTAARGSFLVSHVRLLFVEGFLIYKITIRLVVHSYFEFMSG